MKTNAERFGLPPKAFLYTLDQIAYMLSMTEQTLKRTYIYFDTVHVGKPPKDKLLARNIAPDDSKTPEWRVSEKEFTRWLKRIGFRVYDRGIVE